MHKRHFNGITHLRPALLKRDLLLMDRLGVLRLDTSLANAPPSLRADLEYIADQGMLFDVSEEDVREDAKTLRDAQAMHLTDC